MWFSFVKANLAPLLDTHRRQDRPPWCWSHRLFVASELHFLSFPRVLQVCIIFVITKI